MSDDSGIGERQMRAHCVVKWKLFVFCADPDPPRASDILMSEVRFSPHEEIEHPSVAHSWAMRWVEGSCPFQDLDREWHHQCPA